MGQIFQILNFSFLLMIVFIDFTHQDWFPPTPHIDGRRYAFVNETIILTCTVNNDEDLFFDLAWNNTNTANQRIQEGKKVEKIVNDMRNVKQNLTVQNAQLSDSGIYSCYIVEKRGSVKKTNQQELFLKILEPGTCIRNITTNGTNEINETASQEKEIFFNVLFEAFPSATVRWKKENGLIRSGDGEGKYLINDTGTNSTLVIKKINRKDSANYTMTISQCNETEDISFSLIVWEKPSVTIYPIYNIYLRGSKNNITCRSEGNPRPRIEWEWSPCLNHSCEVQENHFKMFNNLKNNSMIVETETLDFWGIISYLEFTSEESGHFRCRAVNDYGDASDSYIVVVTDYKNGFAIKASESKVIEGSVYKLECGISLYNYTSLFWEWTPKFAEEEKYIRIDPNVDGIQLENKSSSDTFAQVIVWDKISINNSGSYKCITINKNSNKTESKVKDIEVQSSKSNVKNSTWSFYLIIIFSVILIALIAIIMKKIKVERDKRMEMEMIGQMLFEHGEPNIYNPDLPLDNQVEFLPYDKRWEFPKERIKLGKVLGQGAFGRVVKAELIGFNDEEPTKIVAVKMLKQRSDLTQKKALMQELKIMTHLGHHVNVVNLLGAVTKNIKKGELLVIVEFCRFGNLREFLLIHRDNFINQIDSRTGKINQRINFHNSKENSGSGLKEIAAYVNATDNQINLLHYAELAFGNSRIDNNSASTDMSDVTDNTTSPKFSCSTSADSGISEYITMSKGEIEFMNSSDLLGYSFQIARGMEYLSSRKLLHRDLAARNILLADDNVIKICDFGLAKDLYNYSNYKRKGNGPLPVKWLALESIRDKIFTTQSDVWSFGIVLWEIFTLGEDPYPGFDIDIEFYRSLKNGYRMEKPEYSTAEVYEIMRKCWLAEPKERPTFTELVKELGSQLDSDTRRYYVNLNDPYMALNDIFEKTAMDNGSKRNYANINHSPLFLSEYANIKQDPRKDSGYSDDLLLNSPTRSISMT